MIFFCTCSRNSSVTCRDEALEFLEPAEDDGISLLTRLVEPDGFTAVVPLT